MFLKYQMLQGDMRAYIVKVKKPLMEAIVKVGSGRISWLAMAITMVRIIYLIKKYPEPTRENCLHPNTLKICDIEDNFFKSYKNDGRKPLFRTAFKLLKCEYEHDKDMRRILDWLKHEADKSDWLPMSPLPMNNWEEEERIEGTFPVKALSQILEAKEPMDSNTLKRLIFSIEDGREF